VSGAVVNDTTITLLLHLAPKLYEMGCFPCRYMKYSIWRFYNSEEKD